MKIKNEMNIFTNNMPQGYIFRMKNHSLPPGLYEQIISNFLNQQLSGIDTCFVDVKKSMRAKAMIYLLNTYRK